MGRGWGRLFWLLIGLAWILGGCAMDQPSSQAAPDDPDFNLYLFKGRAYLESENPRMAIPSLEKAVSLAPNHIETMELLGKAYHLTGRTHMALATYRKVLTLDPKRQEIRFRMAQLHLQLREWDEAETILNELKENPGIAVKDEILFLLSKVYRNKKDPERMTAVLEEVIQSNPEHMGARLHLAAICHQAGDFPGERKHLTTLLEGRPKEPGIVDRIGDSYLKEGLTKEAILIWEDLLKQDLPADDKKRIEDKLKGAKRKKDGKR